MKGKERKHTRKFIKRPHPQPLFERQPEGESLTPSPSPRGEGSDLPCCYYVGTHPLCYKIEDECLVNKAPRPQLPMKRSWGLRAFFDNLLVRSSWGQLPIKAVKHCLALWQRWVYKDVHQCATKPLLNFITSKSERVKEWKGEKVKEWKGERMANATYTFGLTP